MNLGVGNSVALIDPLTGATPVFEKNTLRLETDRFTSIAIRLMVK